MSLVAVHIIRIIYMLLGCGSRFASCTYLDSGVNRCISRATTCTVRWDEQYASISTISIECSRIFDSLRSMARSREVSRTQAMK